MSQQLTNKEIAKVFALYLGQKCQLSTGNDIINGYHIGHIMDYEKPVMPKILLTPLDQISDEDAIEVTRIYYMEDSNAFTGKRLIDRLYWHQEKATETYNDSPLAESRQSIYLHQYLISKGYAVPLWFGIDHWANGKTAIELGIALEKK